MSPGESEVVLLPVEATRLYLDLSPFMNIAPLAVRYPAQLGTAAFFCCSLQLLLRRNRMCTAAVLPRARHKNLETATTVNEE